MTAISSISASSSHHPHVSDSNSSLQTYNGRDFGNDKPNVECTHPSNNCDKFSLPQSTAASSEVDCNVTVDTCGGHENDDQVHRRKNSSGRKWEYVWTVQHFSMKEYPSVWNHALKLLLEYSNKPKCVAEDHETKITDSVPSNMTVINGTTQITSHTKPRQLRRVLRKDFSHCIYTSVPISLPLSCRNQHRHRWSVTGKGTFDFCNRSRKCKNF